MKPVLADNIANNLGRAPDDAGADVHLTSGLGSPVPRSLRPPGYAVRGEPMPVPVPVFVTGFYGDGQILMLDFAGAGSQLALLRPTTNTRVHLLIVNPLGVGIIRVNFDNAASAASGIPIPAGGNLFYDSIVPQNDIHIFVPGATTVPISYMNLDITNAGRITRGSQ